MRADERGRRRPSVLSAFGAIACLAAVLLLAPWLVASAHAQTAPTVLSGQYRGLWVDTFNTRLNGPADVGAVIERARLARANLLLVQVRRRGDAWYVDAKEPLPEGVPLEPGFDPLREMLGQAHAAGLEVHAFVSIGAVWNQATLPLNPEHVFNRHGFSPAGPLPGRENWLTRTLLPDGGNTSYGGFRFGTDFWLDFGHPDAATYIVNVLTQLVATYDVDGLHLERVSYPDLTAPSGSALAFSAGGSSVGYNAVSLERFRRAYGLPADAVPGAEDPAWSDWRREQVTALVRRIYLSVMAVRPQVKVSAAVVATGDAPAGDASFSSSEPYWRVYQDWDGWLQQGLVDFVVPMIFRAEHAPGASESFLNWTLWMRQHQHQRFALAGLGLYLNSVEGTLRQLRRALESNATAPSLGAVLYSVGAHNAPVSANPYAVPAGRDTPLRAYEDLAAGLTTGKTTAGQALEAGSTRAAPFAAATPAPVLPWKTSPQTGFLMGTIARADGAPLDTAQITLERAPSGPNEPPIPPEMSVSFTSVQTDGSGFYGFTTIPPDRYRLVITPRDASPVTSGCTITIAPGVLSRLDAALDPRSSIAPCTLTGPDRRTVGSHR